MPKANERCQNCGWTKRQHRKGKCPTKLKDTKFKSWRTGA